jgi:predicted nucleic acid-binding Zn ribbon protein
VNCLFADRALTHCLTLGEAMSKTTTCTYCGTSIDAGREFVYQFESLQFCENEQVLDQIQNSSLYYGEPLRLCKGCSQSVDTNHAEVEEESRVITAQTRFAQKVCVALVIIIIAIYVIMYLFLWGRNS